MNNNNNNNNKTISTLLSDIHDLLSNGKEELDESNLENFLNTIKSDMIRLLTPSEGERKRLRLSAIGREDRKLWYEVNDKNIRKESSSNKMRFFYGHLLEALLLYFAREAGHKVDKQQEEVNLEGIKGHIDAVIDGVLVDVKSASDFSFRKFSHRTLFKGDDPFGYIGQISAYMEALNLEEGAFFAINKNSGELALLHIDDLMTINASERVKHLKKVVNSDNRPERCYEPEEYGVAGNMIVKKNCMYCNYKEDCWSDANDGEGLRTFRYANGFKYFTKVVSEPKVEEIL